MGDRVIQKASQLTSVSIIVHPFLAEFCGSQYSNQGRHTARRMGHQNLDLARGFEST
jgi:hypothetical protein